MRRIDERGFAVACDVRIDLRRRNIGVSEHLLHAAQIRAAFDEMRGRGMAEHLSLIHI